MDEQNKNKTIKLVVAMIVCIILTSLIFTNSIICNDCDKKITGKYYISLSERALCEKCGKEYYRGWPGDSDNVTDTVANGFRNTLIIIEILGFGTAIFLKNRKGINDIKKFIAVLTPDCVSRDNINVPSTQSFEKANSFQSENEKNEVD